MSESTNNKSNNIDKSCDSNESDESYDSYDSYESDDSDDSYDSDNSNESNKSSDSNKLKFNKNETYAQYLKRVRNFKKKIRNPKLEKAKDKNSSCKLDDSSNDSSDDNSDDNSDKKNSEDMLKFKKDEPFAQYLRRVEEHKSKLKTDNYKFVLSFLNQFLNLSGKFKLVSILDFKNIRHKDFILKPERNKELLKSHKTELNKKFYLQLTNKKIDDMESAGMVNIIRLLLRRIGYKLFKYERKNREYYYVKKL